MQKHFHRNPVELLVRELVVAHGNFGQQFLSEPDSCFDELCVVLEEKRIMLCCGVSAKQRSTRAYLAKRS